VSVKIKDFITRDRKVLMDTFNKKPRPESMLQNQLLLLEVLCDIRKCLVEVLFRTDWLKKAKPLKNPNVAVGKGVTYGEMEGIVLDGAFTEREQLGLSKREEKALSHEDRVKIISKRAQEKKASTEEDVEAF